MEEELSESERKAAWAEYKAEVIRRRLWSPIWTQRRSESKRNLVFPFSQSATAANPLGLIESEDTLDTKTDAQLVVRLPFR